MQYLLSEEEYKALGSLKRIEELEQKLQKACILLSEQDQYITCPIKDSFNASYCDECLAFDFYDRLCEYKYKRLSK